MAEQSNIIFDAQSAASLRNLAASLGFYIRRGPGSGEIGNIKTLLDKLAEIYRQDESGSVKETLKQLLCTYCPQHGNDLSLYCPMCGRWAIEATRTHVGYALYKQGVPSEEIEKRLRRRIIRTWADGEYGIVQTSLDGSEWHGGEEVDEEGDPVDAYKLSTRIAVQG